MFLGFPRFSFGVGVWGSGLRLFKLRFFLGFPRFSSVLLGFLGLGGFVGLPALSPGPGLASWAVSWLPLGGSWAPFGASWAPPGSLWAAPGPETLRIATV